MQILKGGQKPTLPKKQKGNALLRKQEKMFSEGEKHIQIVLAATNAEISIFSAQMPEEQGSKKAKEALWKLVETGW